MIYLLLFVVLAGGCSKKDKYVQTFKKDHMNIFSDRYIGKALENLVVSRFFRKFISSASKYRHQMYGFSSSAGCSISILNRCSMSI